MRKCMHCHRRDREYRMQPVRWLPGAWECARDLAACERWLRFHRDLL